jgi:hypothetical protein
MAQENKKKPAEAGWLSSPKLSEQRSTRSFIGNSYHFTTRRTQTIGCLAILGCVGIDCVAFASKLADTTSNAGSSAASLPNQLTSSKLTARL